MNDFVYEPSEWCQCAKEGWRFLHCNSQWTMLQCPDKLKIHEELWANETFILVEKLNVALEGGWKKEDNGLMVQLDIPCCICDENESEEFQHFLEMIDAFAKSESDNGFPKLMLMSTMTLKCISRGLKYSMRKWLLTMSSIKCT